MTLLYDSGKVQIATYGLNGLRTALIRKNPPCLNLKVPLNDMSVPPFYTMLRTRAMMNKVGLDARIPVTHDCPGLQNDSMICVIPNRTLTIVILTDLHIQPKPWRHDLMWLPIKGHEFRPMMTPGGVTCRESS